MSHNSDDSFECCNSFDGSPKMGSSYREIDNVRIEPKKLLFINPFEGKRFSEVIQITNCGVRPVMIRIFPPNCSGLLIGHLTKGQFLCSGMQIKRLVRYNVQMMTLVQSCVIPIYINDTLVRYKVKFITCNNDGPLKVLPSTLVDFGVVDASAASAKRTITLRNIDVKAVRFTIDISTVTIDMNVEPIRGIIMANESIVLNLTAVLFNPGKFSTEFWIICDQPLSVRVAVEVKLPCLTPLFTYNMKAFTFIRFPRVYHGVTVRRQLAVHNESQSAAYFCMMAEKEMRTLTLCEAYESDEDYKCFHICPTEGCMLPNDIRVFTFSFTAPKIATSKNLYLLMFILNRMHFREYNAKDYDDEGTITPTTTKSSIEKLIFDTSILPFDDQTEEESQSKLKFFDDLPTAIRIMVYAELEMVNVSVIPTSITLTDIELKERINRVVNLTNNSKVLPIFFKYRKALFVEVKPSFGCLQPMESKDLSVFIVSRNCDPIRSKLVFDLLDHTHPENKNQFAIIGQVNINFELTSKFENRRVESGAELLLAEKFTFRNPQLRPNHEIMKKHTDDHAYLALPENQSNAIDNRKGRIFKSIYSAIPRYEKTFNEYALSLRDKELLEKKTYYNKYIRRKDKLAPRTSVDTFSPRIVNCVKHKMCEDENLRKVETREFIPLSPSQLAMIHVTPKKFVVENVAYDSTYIHRLKITNRNINFILVFLRPKKKYLIDLGSQARMTIASNEEKEIAFTLLVGQTPFCTYELDVILNNSFVIQTSILLKARPRNLRLSESRLIFSDNDRFKFIELRNDLNVDIPFKWQVPKSFIVDPPDGIVVQGRFVACMVTRLISAHVFFVNDLAIITENKFYNLPVSVELTDYKIKFPKLLSFGEQSINVACHKFIPLTNCTHLRLPFEVQKPLPDGYHVQPFSGILQPLATVNLRITHDCIQVGEMSSRITIIVGHNKKVYCDITGSIIFPKLQFIPEVIRFRKISASSFDVVCVTMINNSNTTATIAFDTERLPEFNFSEFSNSPFYTNNDILYLRGKEEKSFVIHFHPFNPMITSGILPITINKCVQPPKTNALHKPIIKIHAQVVAYKLEVKNWRYNFQYFPHFGYTCIVKHKIRIRNPTRSLITFCIRLDELAEPFNFRYITGGTIKTYECSYVVDLLPDEEVTFQATFNPITSGTYSMRLPVFIREDLAEDVHNNFYFTGIYPAATYSYPHDCIHLGFVPLKFTVSKKIAVDMAFHNPDCDCTISVTDPNCFVDCDLLKVRHTSCMNFVSVNFRNSHSYQICGKLVMECSCPGPNLEVEVFGGCENNIYTTHACYEFFKLASASSAEGLCIPETFDLATSSVAALDDTDEGARHLFNVDLPFFQSGKDPFDRYMYKVVQSVEQWIMEQVYNCTRYVTIPDTICLPEVRTYEKQGRREGIIKVPFQAIVVYMLGKDISAIFDLKYTDKKPVWAILRKYYRSMLNYILELDGFVLHIRSEHLLPYEYYKEFMIAQERAQRILPWKAYYLLTKQSWLDLLLQCYKTFLIPRLWQIPLTSSHQSKLSLVQTASMGSIASFSPRTSMRTSAVTLYGAESMALVGWLNKHFNVHKRVLASAKFGNKMTEEFEIKTIEDVEEDCNDGLALISVLLAYCPFFSEYIVGIYAPANSRLERFNNAYIAMKLLKLLNVSYSLEVIDIIEPSTLKTLTFFLYLYEFLLSFKYKETLVFETELSKKCSQTISIVNDARQKLNYNITFFNNTDKLFSVSHTTISVEAGDPFLLTITFDARFLRMQKTAMLLSGEISGSTYTNSKIYYLEGRPRVDNVKPVEVKAVIYKIKTTTFQIQSPYHVIADYDVYLVGESFKNINDMVGSLISCQSIIDTNALVSVKLDSGQAHSNELGLIEINVQLCNIIVTKKTSCFVFRNKTIGDFIWNIHCKTIPTRRSTVIELSIHKNLLRYPCNCPQKKPDVTNSKCPRNSKIMIPRRNAFLWNAVMECFLRGRNRDEKDFWDEYKQTPTGSHVVQRILNDHKKFLSSDMSYVMQDSYEYELTTRQRQSVVVQKSKMISETSNEDAEILVHLNEPINSFDMKLESVDQREVRKYVVNVIYEK